MRANYDTFMKMLSELNEYISSEYNEKYILEVRAIGGFSMIIHNRIGNVHSPRTQSRDIDSLTPDYPAEIIEKIKEIGKKYGYIEDDEGWLNNHWNHAKSYNEEFEYFVRWQELKDASFSNIRVYYADLESLLMFKIRAIDNRIELAHAMPREQDVMDVISILRAYKINDLDNIANETISNTLQYFPFAVNYLINNNMVKGTKRDIRETVEQTSEYKSKSSRPISEEMLEIRTKYFSLPKPERNGIKWNGKIYSVSVFEDLYLAECAKENIKPDKKLKKHFFEVCVSALGYIPRYCEQETPSK